jgi:hypothetical protein
VHVLEPRSIEEMILLGHTWRRLICILL